MGLERGWWDLAGVGGIGEGLGMHWGSHKSSSSSNGARKRAQWDWRGVGGIGRLKTNTAVILCRVHVVQWFYAAG